MLCFNTKLNAPLGENSAARKVGINPRPQGLVRSVDTSDKKLT